MGLTIERMLGMEGSYTSKCGGWIQFHLWNYNRIAFEYET